VKITGLAEELTPPVDHRFDVLVTQLGGFLHAPFERFVRVADELEVDAQFDFAHGDGV
jgi:hypothetical protein